MSHDRPPKIDQKIEMWARKKGWENLDVGPGSGQAKQEVQGVGMFRDEHGQANLGTKTLVNKWRKSWVSVFFMFGFAAFWNGIVGVFCWAMINGEKITVNGRPYKNIQEAFPENIWLVIFLIFPLIGLALLWSFVCLMFNSTRYAVSGKGLEVTHGPIPGKGGLSLSRSEIIQFYVQRKVRHSKNRTYYSYRLMVQVQGARDKVVDSRFNNYEDARILEQWLERKLGIEDKQVLGEVGS